MQSLGTVFFLVTVWCMHTSALSDFQDNVGNYRFIYHNNHRVLLVMEGNNCYFINTASLEPGALEISSRNETEMLLMQVLKSNETGQLLRSTVEEVHTIFRDLLSGYHCFRVNMSIFLIENNPFISTAAQELQDQLQGLNCHFEDGMCSWLQGIQHQLQWHLHKGSTSPDNRTGPVNDHTLGNETGEYIFMNSTEGKGNDSAELLSPYLAIASPVCLQIWYNMHGADVNTLSVSNRDAAGHITEVWTKSGAQGSGWQHDEITVYPAGDKTQTQIVISASRGASSSGDIAVDDVTVTQGACYSGSSTSGLQIQTTAHIATLNDLQCNFEDGWCGWKVKNWHLHKGPTLSGTNADHTYNTAAGEYLYMEKSQGQTNATAELMSPYLTLTHPICLQFWASMHGHGDSRIEVLVKTPQGQETVINATVAGVQGQEWQEVKVTISPRSNGGQQQVVVRGYQGDHSASDIAIDDVTVDSTGACSASGNAQTLVGK